MMTASCIFAGVEFKPQFSPGCLWLQSANPLDEEQIERVRKSLVAFRPPLWIHRVKTPGGHLPEWAQREYVCGGLWTATVEVNGLQKTMTISLASVQGDRVLLFLGSQEEWEDRRSRAVRRCQDDTTLGHYTAQVVKEGA